MSGKIEVETDFFSGVCGSVEIGASVPHTIIIGIGETWAIKITKDGIISNPNVSTDDGAKAVFAALEPYVRSLIERKKGEPEDPPFD